jgi:hypothetical protein
LEMPNTQVRHLSPLTYMHIPTWAPLISCPPDCKGYKLEFSIRLVPHLHVQASLESQL